MKNNDNYCIYMHINKIDGKVYIGQTCQKPEDRWKNGFGYKKGTHFRNAINLYGWENFEHIVWANNLTLEEANRVERLLISLWDARNPEKGYNICFGGDNHNISDETKRKIGATKVGNQNMLGKHHSEETKKKISDSHKGEKCYNYGKHLSNEHKRAISQSLNGRKNTWQSKKVVQLTKDDEVIHVFDSGCDAEKQTGICNTSIFRAIRTGICAGGYRWKYYEEGTQYVG